MPKEEEFSLGEIILKGKIWYNFLKSKWSIILIGTLFGIASGFFYAYFQKNKFTASLTFALEEDKSSSGGLSGALGLASSLGFDLGTNAGGAFSGANLMELMKSRTIIEKVLLNRIKKNNNTVSLADYYLDFSGERKRMVKDSVLNSIRFMPNEIRENFSIQKDSILGTIYEKFVGTDGTLNIFQKDKKVSIISVEVNTQDELFSKVLVETVVKEVSDFYISTKSKKARTNVAILQKQVDSIRNELNIAISGVAAATDNTFNLNSAMLIKKAQGSSKQIDVQANAAILTQLVTNLEMAKVTLLKETPLIQIIDKPILPLKKEKTSKLKSMILGGVVMSIVLVLFLMCERAFKSLLK